MKSYFFNKMKLYRKYSKNVDGNSNYILYIYRNYEYLCRIDCDRSR